jgi:hypothetical protein
MMPLTESFRIFLGGRRQSAGRLCGPPARADPLDEADVDVRGGCEDGGVGGTRARLIRSTDQMDIVA